MIRRIIGFLIVAIAVAGCHKGDSDGLAVQPVKGTVVRGDQPVGANWTVTFVPETQQDATINGLTDAQGNFTLKTIGASGQKPGAPEGTYTVTVTTAMDANQSGSE